MCVHRTESRIALRSLNNRELPAWKQFARTRDRIVLSAIIALCVFSSPAVFTLSLVYIYALGTFALVF